MHRLEYPMSNVQMSSEQQCAVDMCCDMSNAIACVTGGAGVGKTLVMGQVYKELRKMKKTVALCAPTGRAAKRVQELTGIAAKTVHRLLQFPMPDDPDDGEKVDPNLPRRNRENPLDEQVVIVDESSMISPGLYRFLMDALRKGGVIRWFGDNNQLPPVEEGKPPFISLLKEFPSIELTYNYRSGDAIVDNAMRILRGQFPMRNSCFEILYNDRPLDVLLEFVTPEFSEENYQIIMPTRKGKSGTIRANPSLQMRFNSKGPMLRLDRFDTNEAPLAIRARDKFIWVRNDYKLDLFNGEIGYVDWVDPDAGELGIVTGKRAVVIPPRIKTYNSFEGHIINYDPRKQIELGYAITTHKSQGSEFDTVVYCMSRSQIWLLNKRNFYTAVTRAKKNVILITDRRAMGLSMRSYDV
jgi:exodeoxyribonuclease V alpha subunit